MEACHTTSSSSSSSQIATQGRKTSYPSADLLHSVRRPLHKPWRKPVAPLPPNLTRVYKVKPMEFKDLVQKLTGAQTLEFEPSCLQTVAPAPLHFHLGGSGSLPLSAPAEVKAGRVAENYTSPFALSPSSNSWCSFLLSSPGSMSGLDQSTVL